MGLFDGYSFMPDLGNGVGGLLGNLPTWAYRVPAGSGFSPALTQKLRDTASDDDEEAAVPAKAAPTAAPMAPALGAPALGAPAMPQQQGGFMDGLSNSIANNANLLMALGGGTMMGGFGKGLAMAAQAAGQRARGSLVNAGDGRLYDPNTGKWIIAPAAAEKPEKTTDISEYNFAVKNGYRGSFMDWQARKSDAKSEYGLNPVYGVDAEGKPTLLQLSKSGTATQSKLPEGVTFAKEPIRLDAGTHYVLLDPITRQNVGVVPKDLKGKAIEEAKGEAQGKAITGLPEYLGRSDAAIKLIEDIEKDPNLKWATGVTSFTTKVPGTPMFDLGQKFEQLHGKTFLDAYQTLRGGGAITDVEGKKATDAVARLNNAQTEGAYRQALSELKEVITAGRERMAKMAGQEAPAKPASPPAMSGQQTTKSGVSWSVK